jgi:NAD-dependent dihydropyrimidine dehydrogenase PreA subunit
MIEVVLSDRCTKTGTCAKVCPNDVFDFKPGAPPVIARQEDCVTCFICEAFCKFDALYVSPKAKPDPVTDIPGLLTSGVVGSYRRVLGWDRNAPGAANVDPPDIDTNPPYAPIGVGLEEANNSVGFKEVNK